LACQNTNYGQSRIIVEPHGQLWQSGHITSLRRLFAPIGHFECNGEWLLKNSRFAKIAEIWDIENV
jgi:hemolysin-activating ACP:hemolysin acyltransferase